MQSIEEKALNTYQLNLNYFAEEHPEVYKKINLLNMAIESSQYKEKYALEYRDGCFDIQELKTKQFLYGENSDKISEQVAKEVNFTKTDNVIETFYRSNLTKEQAQKLNDSTGVISDALYAVSNIVYYTTNTIPKIDTKFKRVEKYIYFGIGIGKHIKLIQDKLQSSKVLVVESDIELFKLSLFTVNYKNIFKNTKVFYSIADDKLAFKYTIDSFLEAGYNHNQYIKYTIFSDIYITKIKQIQDIIVTNNLHSYPYSMQLMDLIKTPEYLVEGYKYIDISKTHKDNTFSDKPAILVAAGPSLIKNIKWLKENQDKFIIVAVLASIQTLHKYGIKPDVIINLDAHQVILKFFKDIDIKTYLKDVKFIFSSMVHKKVVQLVPQENLYIFESTTNYKVDFGKISTPSVGEMTYALLLTFGVKNLYLLGLDLALDPKTKQKYANSQYESNRIGNEKEDIFNTKIHKTITEVKGNFLTIVPSLSLFTSSIFAFAEISKHKKLDNQYVYNLNNGAFLEGATPLKIENLKINIMQNIDKNTPKFKKSLSSFLDSISENRPSEKDIIHLTDSIDEAVELYKILQKYNEVKSFSSAETYMLHFAKLINDLLKVNEDEKCDINIIMYNYIKYISTYIFDFFNTQKLKNQKKHIKFINKTFIQQTGKMLKVYIDTMKIYRLYAEEKLKESKS